MIQVHLNPSALDYVISITAGILGPLAVGVAVWWLGKSNEDKRVKSEAIRDLMTYRGDLSSPEFQRALNKVSITFHDDADIRKEIRELYEAINNPSLLDEVVKRKIVGVIFSLCQKNGYTQITEYDIDQSFLEAKQTPQGDAEETVTVPRQEQDVPNGTTAKTRAASAATKKAPVKQKTARAKKAS